MKNRTVNIVNNNLQYFKKKNIVFQLHSFYYYSIYNIYSENTIYSHSKKFNAMKNPQFSFYRAPVQNLEPYKTIGMFQTYQVITGDYYKDRTARLRSFQDEKTAKKYKAIRFDYVTFSGRFTQRRIEGLIEHSGLICLDFDHLDQSLTDIKTRLINDPELIPALLFVSPGGNGLKLVLPIDLNRANHKTWFFGLSNYYKATYGLEADKSGSDVSRACFLAWDPEAYINPKYNHQ